MQKNCSQSNWHLARYLERWTNIYLVIVLVKTPAKDVVLSYNTIRFICETQETYK